MTEKMTADWVGKENFQAAGQPVQRSIKRNGFEAQYAKSPIAAYASSVRVLISMDMKIYVGSNGFFLLL